MRVLLAIDGLTHSEAAVAAVSAGLWPQGTEVRVITVVHATAPLMPDPALVIAAIHVVQTKEQVHVPRRSSRRQGSRFVAGLQGSRYPQEFSRACRRTRSSMRRASGTPI